MAYVFYDLETSGLNPRFDQILQFAAIRTDDGLNEVDRFEVRCRLLSYVVPSPAALLVHRTSPRLLTDPALPSHFEAICQIHRKLMEWVPATFVGYNSIRFDDEFLRQAFYKALLPVYLTNSEGNARMDGMHIVQAASLWAPGCLSIPVGGKGRPSFSLVRLARANGFAHEQAHDAMADVRAMIFLMGRVRERAPDVWRAVHLTSTRLSATDILTKNDAVRLVECYGSPRSYRVASCGSNPDNPLELAAFDLSEDPREFAAWTVDEWTRALDGRRKVIRTIRANRHPILAPLELSPAGAHEPEMPGEEWARRAAWIRANPGFRCRVVEAMRSRAREYGSSPFVEDQLYEGFVQVGDRMLMAQFHVVDWDEKLILRDLFTDPRVKEIATRIIGEERSDLLAGQASAGWTEWALARLFDERVDVPWMTVPKALLALNRLWDDAEEDQRQALLEVQKFLEGYSRGK